MTNDRSRATGDHDWAIEDPEAAVHAARRLVRRIEQVFTELAQEHITKDDALTEILSAVEAFADERGE